MQDLFQTMAKVAPSSANVLIQGESGTGKELVARAIHDMSDRCDKPFRAINCASIPSDLLESELFGHRKGAFTGASVQHQGLFEASTGGTIFLDEIGDMPILLQSKLLRVLQESKVRPVGSNDEIQVDVRIVAATHQNLGDLVRKKKFREDLYFRLNVIPLVIPPLRMREEDMQVLTEHFLEKFSHLHMKSVTQVSPDVIEAFKKYGWPGNVRELENSIERAVLLTERNELRMEDFGWLSAKLSMPGENFALPVIENGVFKIPLSVSLKELEGRYIKAYCQAHPNMTQEDVATGLGINRKTLYRKFQAEKRAAAAKAATSLPT